MILIARRKTLLVVGWFAVAVLPSTALAQGNVFNPYGNSGYPDYREFAVPMYSNDPALPGQARLQSQPLGARPRGPNQFEQYFDRLDDAGASATNPNGARGNSPTGMPYYQSFRRFDKQYDRVYTPNNTKADKAFNERLRLRDEKFAEALKEPDPVKRARMIRELQGTSATRPAPAPKGSSASSRAPRPRSAAPGTKPATSGSAGPVPYPRGYTPPVGRAAPRPKGAATSPAPAPAGTPAPVPTPAEGSSAAPAPR